MCNLIEREEEKDNSKFIYFYKNLNADYFWIVFIIYVVILLLFLISALTVSRHAVVNFVTGLKKVSRIVITHCFRVLFFWYMLNLFFFTSSSSLSRVFFDFCIFFLKKISFDTYVCKVLFLYTYYHLALLLHSFSICCTFVFRRNHA